MQANEMYWQSHSPRDKERVKSKKGINKLALEIILETLQIELYTMETSIMDHLKM